MKLKRQLFLRSHTPSDEGKEVTISEITHTVVFKYIGAHKERQYQETLTLASQKLKEKFKVQVKLQLEPDNRYDSKTQLSCAKLTTQVGLDLTMLYEKC